jgi:protein O-mannosyl-transferase
LLYSPSFYLHLFAVVTTAKDKPVEHRPFAALVPWVAKLRCPGLICLVLAIITFAAYLPASWNSYVDYDDADYVRANPHVLSGLTAANIAWAFTTGHASNWHPLTWISHMLDVQLLGKDPGPQHFVSVLIHLLNTVLLFRLLRRLTGAHWPSAFVAILFGLHPLHVESVAWISERKDVLSTLFLLLATLAYTRYVETRFAAHLEPATPIRRLPWLAWYVLALILFACGLMSKPMLVTLPCLLLLLDYWPLCRFELGISRAHLRALAGPLLEKFPFLLLTVASSAVTLLVQREGGAVSTNISWGARVSNALVSYVRYIRKMFWPSDLSVLYLHPGHWPAWQVIASGVLLVVIFGAVILFVRRRKYLLVGWLWFFGGLIPVIGLVQVGIQSMADRYTYVPIIGLFIIVALGAAELTTARPRIQRFLPASAAMVVAACAVLTFRQTGFWKNSETLFLQAVAVDPKNYLALNNLGYYYNNQGKPDLAIEYYRKSLDINPSYEDALNNLGYALAGRRQFAEAVGYYLAALRIRPDHVEVHNNLGNALSELGRIDEAIQHYRFVLERKPDHADAHNNLGIALAMKGRLDEAVSHFRKAIDAKPDYAGAHSNLGNAYAVQHKTEDAIHEYLACLQLNPRDAQAHNNLANVYAETGRLVEAIRYYHEALRLNADNPEAHYNLAMAFLRSGETKDALGHLRDALRLRPNYPEAQRQFEALTAHATP